MAPQLGLFEIVVSDMARSLAFYRRLGLDIPAEADEQPHVDVPLAGGIRLAFDTDETIASFDPTHTPSRGSRASLAFRLDDPSEVDALYAELVAAGYEGHLEPWNAFWGMRYAVVHDPDGLGVDLYADLPK